MIDRVTMTDSKISAYCVLDVLLLYDSSHTSSSLQSHTVWTVDSTAPVLLCIPAFTRRARDGVGKGRKLQMRLALFIISNVPRQPFAKTLIATAKE